MLGSREGVRFDDCSTFFFEMAFCWDTASGKAADGGGLFGKAPTCTSGTETQGGVSFSAALEKEA